MQRQIHSNFINSNTSLSPTIPLSVSLSLCSLHDHCPNPNSHFMCHACLPTLPPLCRVFKLLSPTKSTCFSCSLYNFFFYIDLYVIYLPIVNQADKFPLFDPLMIVIQAGFNRSQIRSGHM